MSSQSAHTSSAEKAERTAERAILLLLADHEGYFVYTGTLRDTETDLSLLLPALDSLAERGLVEEERQRVNSYGIPVEQRRSHKWRITRAGITEVRQ